MKELFNDADVRRVVSQAMVTVEGESTLYDKIAGEIQAVYIDLQKFLDFRDILFTDDQQTGETEIKNEELWQLVQDYIIGVAMAHKVHSLDLVLTANGFGIVSNQTIAPASATRVADYKRELLHNALSLLRSLLYRFSQIEEWHITPAYLRMSYTPFFYGEYIDEELFTAGNTDSSHLTSWWSDFNTHVSYIDRYYMGYSFAQALREKAISNNLTEKEFQLFQQYKTLCALKKDTPDNQLEVFPFLQARENLLDILIEGDFSAWKESNVGRSFLNSPKYENRKNAGGFWL